MKKIKTTLGALAFVFLIGGLQACTDSPTAPNGEEPARECYWFDGMLHCVD